MRWPYPSTECYIIANLGRIFLIALWQLCVPGLSLTPEECVQHSSAISCISQPVTRMIPSGIKPRKLTLSDKNDAVADHGASNIHFLNPTSMPCMHHARVSARRAPTRRYDITIALHLAAPLNTYTRHRSKSSRLRRYQRANGPDGGRMKNLPRSTNVTV